MAQFEIVYVKDAELNHRNFKIMKMKRPNPSSFWILIINFHDLYLFAIQNS